ncbi:MAG: hypothetical protein GYA55_06625, partial [SAR324 cluster bacterium]|nr:hypothetical protein [SAR324 cluster bacterium]
MDNLNLLSFVLDKVKYKNMHSNKSTNHVLHVIVSGLLTLILLFLVFTESSLSDLRDIFNNLNKSFLTAFVVCSLTALVLRAWRYKAMLEAMGVGDMPSLWKMLLVTGIRNAFVDFLPARLGELSYIYFLNRLGVRVSSGVSSFGLCIALDLLSLILVAAIFALFSIVFGTEIGLMVDLKVTQVILAFLLLSIMFILGAFLLVRLYLMFDYMSKIFEKFPRLNRAGAMLSTISTDLNQASGYRDLFYLLVLTVLLRVAKYAGLYFVALAVLGAWGIGAEALNPLASFAVFVLSEASASLPISGLMGFGIYEGVWSTLFSYACGGICEGLPATTIAFSVHLITQIIGYGMGIFCLLFIGAILFFNTGVNPKRLGVGLLLFFLLPFSSYGSSNEALYFDVSKSIKLEGKLAFSAIYEGHSRVYVLDFKDNVIQELGPKGVDLSYPSLSPDGKLLAVSIGPEAKRNIAVMTVGGEGFKVLGQSDLNSDNPAFSPDSSSVVFYREQRNNPKISNLFIGYPDRPEEVRQLTNLRG